MLIYASVDPRPGQTPHANGDWCGESPVLSLIADNAIIRTSGSSKDQHGLADARVEVAGHAPALSWLPAGLGRTVGLLAATLLWVKISWGISRGPVRGFSLARRPAGSDKNSLRWATASNSRGRILSVAYWHCVSSCVS